VDSVESNCAFHCYLVRFSLGAGYSVILLRFGI